MTQEQMYITAISALAGAIGILTTYIAYIHKEHAKELKKMLISSIESGNKMAAVIENNNKLISQMLDKL